MEVQRASKKEYQLWLGDFVTREVRKLLLSEVEQAKAMWADGAWENKQFRDAYFRGYINGLLRLEHLDDFFEEGDGK
jgi:hypothetical protein